MHQKSISAKALPVLIASTLLLAGCFGMPPKVVYPDGSNTVPANDPERIAALMTAREKSRNLVAENAALRAQVETMRQQLVDIRVAVAGVLAQSGAASSGTSAQEPAVPRPATAQVAPTEKPLSMPGVSALGGGTAGK